MSDVFHTTYRELTDGEKIVMKNIKDKASELLAEYEHIQELITEHPERLGGDEKQWSSKREVALAKTKLEESVMWAVKAITI